MHGQFYSHQYLQQRTGVPQNNASSVTSRTSELTQQGQLRFPSQHAGMINGQAFQARTAQQPQQQQRLQQMQQPTADQLAQQRYAQLLQNQSYQAQAQALYNQALQQQQQSQATRQQEQQRLLQQQQNATNEQSLRALLSNPYQRETLNQMQQQMATLNQLGLGQASVSPHHLAANLQHQQVAAAAAAKTASIPRYQEEMRNLSRVLEQQQQQQQQQRSRQEEASLRSQQQQGLQHAVRNMSTQNSTPQSVRNQDLLNMSRHMSPSAAVPSPPGYSQNPNLYSNVLLSPPGNTGLISPHGNAYSPAMGHLSNVGANRVPSTPAQIATRTEVAVAAPAQDISMQASYPTMPTRNVSQDLQSPNRAVTATPGSVTDSKIYVKRQTPSVNSCTAPVIIVDSEDEDDEQQQPSTSRSSEKREAKPEPAGRADFTRVVIDDDIEITGVREAEIMSHMRPDCPIHPFHRVDNVTIGPQAQNALKCGKCYCYVCDKLAKECIEWATPGQPHCNAHARASCWKARRNTKKSPLMMKLASDEVTAEMAEAGELAMQYMITIREFYITYRNGTPCEYNKVPCNCQCHRAQRGHEPCMNCKVVHDMKKHFNYEPVREAALSIIREIRSKYSRDHPEMALIMLEAVLSELCSQRPADFNHSLRMPSNPDTRCQCNFPKIIDEEIEPSLVDILTRHEVKASLRNHLIKCVEEAIKPLQLKDILKKFISMRHWDNLLLRAVLTGSNISGSKGREVLRETADVVKMRVEKLDREKRYQSVTRYLKTVKILQSPKSSVSNNQIMVLMDQWMLLYAAKQGHFKDVILRLTEPIVADKTARVSSLVLSSLQPDFVIQLLDALAGKDAQQNTRIDSFDPKNSHGPYVVAGKDADVLLLLFHYIVQQNNFAATHVPCYLWLAKWVNRNQLSPCLDPNRIKPWRDEGSLIMETAMRVSHYGQCQSFLMQCEAHDPHVHLFNASINIVNAVTKFPDSFKPDHLEAIIEAYKSNEWALFLLLTQSPMMNFHNINILHWITKFCDSNNGSLAQIKDRVVIESIAPYRLDDVSEFLKSLIKPDWVNSIESIQRTVLAVASEYSLRLLDEMKRCDLKVLVPKAKWLEEIVLKYVEEQRISANLLREEQIVNYLKNISKVCSYLNPVKRNVEFYRRFSPSTEWLRRCSQLIQFLSDKFTKERLSGTMEEFSTLLWLLWMIGDLERLGAYFTLFQDRHSCSGDVSKVTSSKVIDEVANLLDSSPNPETLIQKRSMVEKCRRLCVLETLSWLTCTDCATKMSSSWTRIWVSIAKSNLRSNCVRLLNHDMMEQFKMWLNKISLDSPDNYNRLLGCMRSFLNTLITTWHDCSLSYEECRGFVIEIAGAVVNQRLKSDLESIGNGIIQVEVDKLKPKITEVPERRPSNHLGTHRPPSDLSAPVTSSAVQSHHHIPQASIQAPPASRHKSIEKAVPHGVPKEQERTQKPPEKLGQKIANSIAQQKTEPPAKTRAVMSPDALFTKKAQNNKFSPQKSVLEKQNSTPKSPTMDQAPFSPTNLARTKKCQNCGAMISCASFRCPKCNQAARSVQPVTCPQCHQENRELKGYSCQYCYRSLLDVLFGGGERPPVASDDAKDEAPQRKKKKSADKRKKKSKPSHHQANNTAVATVVADTFEAEILPQPKNDDSKKLSPLTVKISNNNKNLLDNSSDSSSDDFVMEKPPKKRKRHASNPAKVPPLKLKRKPSIPPPISNPVPQTQHGASLTDSDSDSDMDEKTALIITTDENSDSTKKPLDRSDFSPTRQNTDHFELKSTPYSPQKTSLEKPIQSVPRPQISNPASKPKSVPTTDISPPKTTNATHNSIAGTHTPPVKRGVGHSSMMSKKQKNILSRLKRPGMPAPKIPTPSKTTPPNSRPSNKDILKSPPAGSQKRISLDNGPTSSPGRGQIQERQRHDSSCSSGSVGSGSGLSFGLAKVAEKRPKNVGHRTGGPPGSGKKMNLNRNPSSDNSPHSSTVDNSKRTLFPQALNHSESNLNHGKKKNKKRKRELMIKMPSISTKQALERRLNSILTRRKPGPASRSNYRKILKIEHKLRKLERPHRRWRIPSFVKLPPKVDLTRYAAVSLASFPRDKLYRIQRLVPCYRLKTLFA